MQYKSPFIYNMENGVYESTQRNLQLTSALFKSKKAAGLDFWGLIDPFNLARDTEHFRNVLSMRYSELVSHVQDKKSTFNLLAIPVLKYQEEKQRDNVMLSLADSDKDIDSSLLMSTVLTNLEEAHRLLSHHDDFKQTFLQLDFFIIFSRPSIDLHELRTWLTALLPLILEENEEVYYQINRISAADKQYTNKEWANLAHWAYQMTLLALHRFKEEGTLANKDTMADILRIKEQLFTQPTNLAENVESVIYDHQALDEHIALLYKEWQRVEY